jgi:long-chain fatty acid transport protein
MTKTSKQQSTNKFLNLKTIASRSEVTKLFGFAATLSTLFSAAHVHALGIRLPDQDAFATGRGEAFVATADNPSAIYYNPAGIMQLDGINARVGGYGIYINDHYSNAGGASVNTKQKLQGIPQLFATGKIPNIPMSLGLGVYAPYGLGLEWPDNAPFLSSLAGTPPAVFPTVPKKGEIEYLTLNPVIAFKPHKTLSISAGPTLNYAETELRFVPFGAAANNFRFRGRDEDIGFNAGILWQPCEKHSFGASYRSATTMEFEGHADTSIPAFAVNVPGEPASTRFNFPQNVIVGYSFRPTTNWNLEINADWTDWSRLKQLSLSKQFTGTATLPLEWQSSWFYEFGATRYFNGGWRVSAGYIYSENSVPSATFNPIVPDSDRHIFSVGVGRTYHNRLSWDLAYQLAYGPDRTISDQTGGNVFINGTYRYISHALSFNVGYHF